MNFTSQMFLYFSVGVAIAVFYMARSWERSRALKKQLTNGSFPFSTSEHFQLPIGALTHAPETIEAIQSNIQEGELVFKMVLGFVGMKPGICVATQMRILRIYQESRLLGGYHADVKSLDYDNIGSALIEKRMFACIKITSKSGDTVELSKTFQEDAAAFVRYVNDQLRFQSTSSFDLQSKAAAMIRIAKDGKDIGEMQVSKARLLLASGHLKTSDYYLDSQLNKWIELSNCDELR